KPRPSAVAAADGIPTTSARSAKRRQTFASLDTPALAGVGLDQHGTQEGKCVRTDSVGHIPGERERDRAAFAQRAHAQERERGDRLASPPPRARAPAALSARVRPSASGKFLYMGEDKLYVRGATYGTFRPNVSG